MSGFSCTTDRARRSTWQLDVARQSRHVFKFGSYTIRPYGYVTIHTGKGTGTQTDRYWNRSWYVWNGTRHRPVFLPGH
jgi:hypothetical protein